MSLHWQKNVKIAENHLKIHFLLAALMIVFLQTLKNHKKHQNDQELRVFPISQNLSEI
jgi:hypothetical protein